MCNETMEGMVRIVRMVRRGENERMNRMEGMGI